MNNSKFLIKEEFNDGKYQILSMTDGEANLRRILCNTPSICLFPFDTIEGKIRNVYLARYMDYLNGEHGHTCITLDSNGEFNSHFEEVEHACKKELNINCDVNDMYYLGKIKSSLPFTKEMRCYGINLDNHSKDLSGFTIDTDDSDNKMHVIDRIRFTRILNGEIEDAACLSACLLLVSYLDK